MNTIALDPTLLSTPRNLATHSAMTALKTETDKTGAADTNKGPLYEKAKQLEGLFLNTLVSEMFKDIKTKGMFGGGYAEQTWRSMQAEQISAQIAQSGGVGLADDIMKNLLTTQEAHAPNNGAKTK